MKLKELIEKRASLVTEMRSILDTAQAEKRELTADDESKYDKIEAEVDKLGSQINRLQALEKAEASLDTVIENGYRPSIAGQNAAPASPFEARNTEEYRDAFFQHYARVGKNNLGSEILNALSTGTDSEGGYLVPEEFETMIVTFLQQMDPIRALASVITTGSDRNIPLETTRGDFAYIDEAASYGEDDPVIGRQVLGAFKSGGIIKVSEELIQDAFFDIGAYLSENGGRRFGALESIAHCTGTGTGQPTGLFATAAVGGVNVQGVTGAVSATPALTSDDVIDTFYTLGSSYRSRATWVAGDGITKLLRKLKDTTDQYMWQPGLLTGQPDTLMGRPYVTSDGAPAPAVDGKSLILGDLSRYVIVDRLGMTMQRLNELYAANGQIGFKFTKRGDAKSIDAKSLVYFEHGSAS